MKKIHFNTVKIFLFLVTAILNEGLSSSGEIKENVLVIIKRTTLHLRGGRWSREDNKHIWFLANQNLGLSGWYRSLLFATLIVLNANIYLSL